MATSYKVSGKISLPVDKIVIEQAFDCKRVMEDAKIQQEQTWNKRQLANFPIAAKPLPCADPSKHLNSS
jgi:hypothetical protein